MDEGVGGEAGEDLAAPCPAADRVVPDWLDGAFAFAEASTGDEGLADRLLDSVRREEGSDGAVGYLFRDSASDTYCLAARGFPATANSDGGLVPSAVSSERKLELAMAILQCKGRFPLVGEYLSVTPR